jgi:hypothetical protein
MYNSCISEESEAALSLAVEHVRLFISSKFFHGHCRLRWKVGNLLMVYVVITTWSTTEKAGRVFLYLER